MHIKTSLHFFVLSLFKCACKMTSIVQNIQIYELFVFPNFFQNRKYSAGKVWAMRVIAGLYLKFSVRKMQRKV